jgi:hypothetical protein
MLPKCPAGHLIAGSGRKKASSFFAYLQPSRGGEVAMRTGRLVQSTSIAHGDRTRRSSVGCPDGSYTLRGPYPGFARPERAGHANFLVPHLHARAFSLRSRGLHRCCAEQKPCAGLASGPTCWAGSSASAHPGMHRKFARPRASAGKPFSASSRIPGNSRRNRATPLGTTIPNSPSSPRIWFTCAVRLATTSVRAR